MILDASALLAFLQREPGAEVVLKHLPESHISAVNWSEAAAKLRRYGAPATEVDVLPDRLGLTVLAFDRLQADVAAAIEPQTGPLGLSLGDRACLALALTRNQAAITADKAWLQMDLPVQVVAIR